MKCIKMLTVLNVKSYQLLTSLRSPIILNTYLERISQLANLFGRESVDRKDKFCLLTKRITDCRSKIDNFCQVTSVIQHFVYLNLTDMSRLS